ncbi:hypothetical protein [Actinomyces polynesiensis]|uniref:hypothetical protein n=1 Tax=Actinomyces polynesiensis TaxID=1325934 RepID=UPI0005BAE63B|nr:hypothetical protein [Actinomyces polynesiensis]
MVDRLVIPVLRVLLWVLVVLGAGLTVTSLLMETGQDVSYPEMTRAIVFLLFLVPTAAAVLGLVLLRAWRISRRRAASAVGPPGPPPAPSDPSHFDPDTVWSGGVPSGRPTTPPPVLHTPSHPETFAPTPRPTQDDGGAVPADPPTR